METHRRADPAPGANVLWKVWVDTPSVVEFMSRVDAAVASGRFSDRFAAFLAHAERVLATLPAGEDEQTAEELAAQLLSHAQRELERAGSAGLPPS